MRRSELVLAGTAATMVGAGYLLVAAAHGALGAARNDDWVYYRSAFRFAREGSFTPYGSTTMLVGQDVLAAPVIMVFGPRIVPLQVFTAAMGVVALVLTYVLIRGALGVAWSAVAVATVALGPVFGSLSASFMTEVPAYLFVVLTLLAGWYAVRHRFSVPWLALALAAGFAAFTIREYSVAAVVAVVLVAALRARSESVRALGVVVVLALAWLGAVTAVYLWRRSVPGAGAVAIALVPRTPDIVKGFFTLAVFTFPTVLAVSPRRLWSVVRRRPLVPVLVVGVIALAWVEVLRLFQPAPFIGNYLTRYGSYSEVLPGSTPVVYPPVVWGALAVLALASGIVMVLVAVLRLLSINGAEARRLVAPPPGGTTTPTLLLAVFVVGYLLVWVVSALYLGAPVFDRNLTPVVPATVALTVLAGRHLGVLRRRSVAPVAAGLVVLAVVGLVTVDASATSDGARWRLAEKVELLGYPAGSIDGGYEWFGLHREGEATGTPLGGERRWWRELFPASPICATSVFAADQSQPGAGAALASVSARSLFGIRYDFVATQGPDDCTVAAGGH